MKRKIKYNYRNCEDPFLSIYLLIKNHKWKWQSVGAFAALGGGIFSPLIGLLLDAVVWLAPAVRLRLPLSKISIAFYVLTFPLLALGSHCADLLEDKSFVSRSPDLEPHKFDLGLKA